MENACKARSADGTMIAYQRSGEGPPVILIGGALSTAESDEPLAKLLAPGFTVITYDRRGRGTSGETAPYTVRREIEDLGVLLREAGGSASVHGMASGGGLALEGAAAGLPITQLAVYEPPYTTDREDLAQNAVFAGQLDALLARGLRDDAVELFLSVMGLPPQAVAGMRQSPVWPELRSLAHTLAYDDAVMGQGLIPAERLATIRTRVMVVDGGFSPVPVRNAARAVADALPRGRHRTLTGQTQEVAPHVLAPVLEEFFTA
jgi:pimeloyl-ACP methyl ester carboxylesterase